MRNSQRFNGLDEWHVVRQFLPKGWEEAARHCGALRRARGIQDPDVLLRTLLVHLADGCSLKETAIRVREAGWCSVSPVALFKRLQAAEEWLRWIAERLWRSSSHPRLDDGRYRVRAVDATTVQEPGSTGTDWRVHYVIDLTDLRCDHYELTNAKGGETLRRIPVAQGDLMMGDRAYGTPKGVAHLAAAGAAALVRIAPTNMPLYTEKGRKICPVSRLKKIKVGHAREWPAWVHTGDEQISGRLVIVKRGRQATEEARKRLRRRASRNQTTLSKDVLAAAGYVMVWTSVPSSTLNAAKVMEYYRVRWQIELAFKRMKSIMGLGHLPKWSDASARAWIHGKLMIAMLIERLIEEADSFSPWGYRLDAAEEPLA